LGLWNSVVATLAVEMVLFAIGAWIYSRTTMPRDRIGRWAWVGLLVFLVAVYTTNVTSPPPPSMTVVAVVGNTIWLLVWWAAWVDRHRAVRCSVVAS
jgi:hypothetical protein